MGYQEVMSMPIRAFWSASGFVERLLADESRLKLEISSAGQDPEATQSLYERLNKQAPAAVKFTGHALASIGAERDNAGFAELASLAG
jgi:hypothetical protein